jgi:hypothetical protein
MTGPGVPGRTQAELAGLSHLVVLRRVQGRSAVRARQGRRQVSVSCVASGGSAVTSPTLRTADALGRTLTRLKLVVRQGASSRPEVGLRAPWPVERRFVKRRGPSSRAGSGSQPAPPEPRGPVLSAPRMSRQSPRAYPPRSSWSAPSPDRGRPEGAGTLSGHRGGGGWSVPAARAAQRPPQAGPGARRRHRRGRDDRRPRRTALGGRPTAQRGRHQCRRALGLAWRSASSPASTRDRPSR